MSLKKDLRECLDAKSKIAQDLDSATNFNISMEEKVYKSNKISLDLLKEIKRLEFEMGFYYPAVKHDSVDNALADFINMN